MPMMQPHFADNVMVFKYIHIGNMYPSRAEKPDPERLRSPCFLIFILEKECGNIVGEFPVQGQCRFVHKGKFGELPHHVGFPPHGQCTVRHWGGQLCPISACFSYLGEVGNIRNVTFVTCMVNLKNLWVGFQAHDAHPWCVMGRVRALELDPIYRQYLNHELKTIIEPIPLVLPFKRTEEIVRELSNL
jgi:hypothetical protein